jgi:uncharacterized membrane protein required for colicin V production
MSWMYYVPWIDIFLGLLFLGLLALGFWQGLLKVLWFLLSLYLAVIVASLYGAYIGRLIGLEAQPGPSGTGGSDIVSSAVGFFVVFVVAVIILFAVIATLFSHVRLPSSLLVLDKVGGIVLGLLASFVVVCFIAYVLNALLSVQALEQAWAFVAVLQAQRATSPLLQLFLSARSVVVAVVIPWLPEVPSFLEAP